MNTTERSVLAGVGAVAVSLLAILAAVAVAPWFSWATNALSDLGVSDGPERWLFNYGLVVAGLLGLGFVPALRATAPNRISEAALVPFVAAMLGIVGVGLFPSGTSIHFPAALTGYLGFVLAPVVFGVGDLLAGELRFGIASVLDGLVHLAVWFPLSFVLLDVAFGLAVPEFVGAVLFNAWVLAVASRAWSDNHSKGWTSTVRPSGSSAKNW